MTDAPISYPLARILIADDTEANLRLLDVQLTSAGYRHIIRAKNAQEVLESLAETLPDLILLDVMMPGCDGYEITRQIRETCPDVFIPIILISALQASADRVKGLQAGANDFISRPYDTGELVARTEAFLAAKAARDELHDEHARLSLLYAVSSALSSRLDVRSLMSEIVLQTVSATGAEKAILALLDERGAFAQKIQMRKGENPRIAGQIDPTVTREGLLGWVIQNKQGVLLPDVSQDTRWVRLPEEPASAGAAVAVPLLRGEDVVGALLLVAPMPGHFTQEHFNLLLAIASQATIALENTYLYENAQRQRSRSEALLTHTADGIITTDNDGCVTRINPSACEMFNLGEDILGRLLSDVLPISIADLLQRAQERGGSVSGEFSIRNEQGEVQRVFSLSVSPISDIGYMLVGRDITPLRELEQFRLSQERAEHARLSLLYTISNSLVAQLDARSLLREIAHQTVHAVGAEKAMLVLLDEQGIFSQKIQITRGEPPRVTDRIDPTVIREGLIGWIIRNRQAVLLADVSKDPRWVPLPDEPAGEGAAVAAPLIHGGRVIGAMLLVSSEADYFSHEQLDLVKAIAAQATIALENAYLFENVRRERGRVEAMLTQTADGVITIDEDGYITRVNPAACDMFSLDEDVLGRAPDEVLHVSIADLLLRARERGEAVSGEFTARDKESGQRRAFFLSISPVSDVGYVLVAQNITPLKELEHFRLERERAEAQRVVDVLSRYMSLPVVERALGDRDLLERRERREAVVLFADLRGFTRLTVDHPPDDVIELLDEFFAEMIEIAHYYEGVIFDFAGDEMMIGFNLPYEQSDANHRALHTAIHMQRRFAELRQKWAGQGFRAGMGIGISRGVVVTGSVGGLSRMNYAIVGQAVNIAHRLVERAEDGQIIASIEVMTDGLPVVEGAHACEIPPFQVKGRDEPLSATLLELES
jgi:PAS domain S-box-containing protein